MGAWERILIREGYVDVQGSSVLVCSRQADLVRERKRGFGRRRESM
jgi:hypothetical protein